MFEKFPISSCFNIETHHRFRIGFTKVEAPFIIDDAKPVHTGTLFNIENGSSAWVSVDGYRLGHGGRK